MEVAYKQIVDGIKIPANQVRTVFDMVDLVYKTLSPQGTLTPEQLQVYDDLRAVMNQVNF